MMPPKRTEPVDAVALYMQDPPSTADLAEGGYNRFDFFTPEDFRALARPKPKVVDIATRRAPEA